VGSLMLMKSEYVLGHSDRELERLQLQARCLEGLTRRLIRECGLTQGMRVLDIGCGAGDVAMLVAEVVGATGKVVAIDAKERAVETARSRAGDAGSGCIEFVLGTDGDLCKHGPFDAAIGRCVLVHQPNPTLMVRRVAAAVRPGGIVAFMEPALHVDFQTIPEIELLHSATECVMRFQRIALPNHDIAGRIVPCFIDAGLPEPQVLWESIVPGSDRTYLRWLVATYDTLLPLMERFGVVDSAVGDAATLYDRIDVAVTAARAQGLTLPYVSAWAKRN
jgi:2-polyprenyl-3-methyl-5-hydroxy-6-metoxy-1,4-benzoquinol methylase